MDDNKFQQLPIYLLADSQLLFWRQQNDHYFLHDQIKKHGVVIKNAVYIGAANNDEPAYFEIFQSAMEVIGFPVCHFIKKSTALDEAKDLLLQADLILLAGGDANVGWQYVKKIKSTLKTCYEQGALLMGISAGAMHLGALGWQDKPQLCASDLFATTAMVSCVVGVHEEKNDWSQLKQVVKLTDGCFNGLGIPFGGGVAIDKNGDVSVFRKTAVRFSYVDNFYHSVLLKNND